jgi:hypothetical protein
MAHQIIRQPDGRYAVLSSITDKLILRDQTRVSLLAHYASAAAQAETDRVERILQAVDAGEPERIYHQFVVTWDEVLIKANTP